MQRKETCLRDRLARPICVSTRWCCEGAHFAMVQMLDEARSSSTGGVVINPLVCILCPLYGTVQCTILLSVLKSRTLMATDVSSHLLFISSFYTLGMDKVNEYIRVLQKALHGGSIGAEMPVVRAVGRRLPFCAAWEVFCVTSSSWSLPPLL